MRRFAPYMTATLIAATLCASAGVTRAQPTNTDGSAVTLSMRPDDDSRGESISWNTSVIATGALLFAGSYGASVVTATATDTRANQRLYLPLVGPWLDLSERTACDFAFSSCGSSTAKVLLAVDGVFQAAGALTMLGGWLHPEHHANARAERSWHVRPETYAALNSTAPGFAVLGSF